MSHTSDLIALLELNGNRPTMTDAGVHIAACPVCWTTAAYRDGDTEATLMVSGNGAGPTTLMCWRGECAGHTDQRAILDALERSDTVGEDIRAWRGVQVEHDRPVIDGFKRLSEIQETRPEWLWPGRMAWGSVVVVAGDGGLGKSTFVHDIAAQVTRGEAPMGGTPRKGAVILLTGEENVSSRIAPRLRLMDADLDLVTVLDPMDATLTLPSGASALAARCASEGARLVVVDTGPGFMDKGLKSNTDEDVRQVLRPLAVMAEAQGLTVVVIAHLNKATGMSAGHRVMGGAAWRNAPRQVLIVGRPPNAADDSPDRVIAVDKNNEGRIPAAVAFRILPAIGEPDHAVIEWGDEVDGVRVDDLVAVVSGEERSERQAAAEFLEAELAEGPRLTRDLKVAAKDADIAWRTVERAKRDLQVVVTKTGLDGAWEWTLPAKTAIKAATRKRGGLGGLGGLDPADEERWEALAS